MRSLGRAVAVACLILAPLAAWLWLWTFLAEHTWTWGRVTFWVLLAIAALIAVVNLRFVRLRVASMHGSAVLAVALLALANIYFIDHQAEVIAGSFGPPWAERLWDVSQGAYDFNKILFEHHGNPYAERAQYHPVDGTLGHSRDGEGRDYLFGLRYYYGYPHFPMSVLWFAPFVGITGGYNDIRLGNLFYYALNLILLNVILYLAGGRRILVCLVGNVAVLAVEFMVTETFQLGIVDHAFAAPLLVAILLAMRSWWSAAGVFAGLALATKHFPAIPVVLALTLYVYRSGRLRVFALSAAAAFALITLPFLLWNPEAFVSATLMHHIHEMRFGDDTALYFFLPEPWKVPFRLFGLAVIAAVYVWGWMTAKAADIRATLLVAAVVCVLINAFYPVTHLNHLESILVFAAASLALGSGSR